MTTKVVLSNQFGTSPVFIYENNDPMLEKLGFSVRKISGPVGISELPISSVLKEDITSWDRQYQDTFDTAYPPDSSFPSLESNALHRSQGAKLARQLQKELGEEYFVEYRP